LNLCTKISTSNVIQKKKPVNGGKKAVKVVLVAYFHLFSIFVVVNSLTIIHMSKYQFITIVTLFLSVSAHSQVTHWRGPEGNGIYPDKNLLKEWPAEGPQMIWHFDELGKGFSSPVFANNRIYITGAIEEQGYVYVLSLDGKLLNKFPYGTEFTESYPGARSSVTIAGDLLYMESGMGLLVCMDTKDGAIRWKKDFLKETDGENITWGFTETVVIDKDVLYCTPGGKKNNVMALNRLTGETIWSSSGMQELSAYCTPLLVEFPARKLLVTMTASHIIGLDASNGKLLWSHSQPNEYSVHANTPVYADGGILCFSGYGQGAPKLKLSPDGSSVTQDWFAKTFDSRMGGAVYIDGYVYGSGDVAGKEWQCLDWKTGEQKYASTAAAKGAVIYADGMLFGYSQRGELFMAKATPTEFKISGMTKITLGSDQHWAHPVIDNGVLYVRRGNALMAFKIK
jgi:outer membrane protein assembly factor BamB